MDQPLESPQPDAAESQTPRVVVLGGGFAAILLYKKLAGAVRRKELQLTIIDRNNFNCFHGLVPEVLTGKIQPANILNPLRTIFRRAQFRNGEIEKVDLERREVCFARALDGKQFWIPYDHLVLDLGSDMNLTLFPGAAEHTLRLKLFTDILQTRHHIITMLELADIEDDPVEVERLLNFVVAGGNYAGVEVASELVAALPEIARARFPRIPVEKIRVTLIHSGERVLPELGQMLPGLQGYANDLLGKYHHMRVAGNCRLASATSEEAILSTGERIPTRTIIICTGTVPSATLDLFPFERGSNGRLVMDEFCRVKGQTNIWAGGDCAAVPRRDGTAAPPLAIWALTTGAQIARNIRRSLAGRPLKPFRFNGLGDACTLGRKRAAAHVRGIPMRGLFGYYVWRTIVLLYLPAWEKKFRLLMDWTIGPIFGSDVVNMNVNKPLGVAPVMYEPNQDIVREGDVGQSLFIIRSGEVEVLKKKKDGTEEVITTLGPGEHFGEVAVFRRVRRTATVRARTRVELLHVRREIALALSESKPEIAGSFASSSRYISEIS